MVKFFRKIKNNDVLNFRLYIETLKRLFLYNKLHFLTFIIVQKKINVKYVSYINNIIFFNSEFI